MQHSYYCYYDYYRTGKVLLVVGSSSSRKSYEYVLEQHVQKRVFDLKKLQYENNRCHKAANKVRHLFSSILFLLDVTFASVFCVSSPRDRLICNSFKTCVDLRVCLRALLYARETRCREISSHNRPCLGSRACPFTQLQTLERSKNKKKERNEGKNKDGSSCAKRLRLCPFCNQVVLPPGCATTDL